MRPEGLVMWLASLHNPEVADAFGQDGIIDFRRFVMDTAADVDDTGRNGVTLTKLCGHNPCIAAEVVKQRLSGAVTYLSFGVRVDLPGIIIYGCGNQHDVKHTYPLWSFAFDFS